MRKLLTMLGDLLFPPRAEELIVRSLTEKDVPELLSPILDEGWVALSPFTATTMRALIHEAKFERNERAQKLLGKLIAYYVERTPHLQGAYFIPVPLSRERMRARGYNQVERVLYHAVVLPHANTLVRVRNTRPQTELTRAERLMNVTDAFACTAPEDIYGKDIILVDDVVTTGATLLAAANEIRKHSPRSIHCIALAH